MITLPLDINIRVHDTRLFKLSGFHIGLLIFLLKVVWDISRSNDRPELLHVPFTSDSKFYGVVMPYLSSKLDISYLVSIHGGGLKKWKPRWMYKRLFSNCNQIVAVSDVVQHEYEKRTGKKVTLILPLIPFYPVNFSKDELRSKFGFGHNENIVLFLGSIKEIKRPIDLLLAAKLLGLEYLIQYHIKIVYVGDGDQRGELEHMAVELGIENHVQVVGKVDFDQTGFFYSLSDIFVIPSKYEGTSKSMLGAMYYGIPIIGSDVSGINNVLRHEETGLLFEFGNNELLARNIRRLIEDRVLRKDIALRAANEYRASYSFEKTVSEFSNLYNCISSSV
jgi:glycosyltransferase involved in cell wall biosynthesis